MWRRILGYLGRLAWIRWWNLRYREANFKCRWARRAGLDTANRPCSWSNDVSLFGNDDDEPNAAATNEVAAGGEEGQGDQPTRPARSPRAATTLANARPTDERDRPTNDRLASIDGLDTDDVMTAFRPAARGRGWLERDGGRKVRQNAVRGQNDLKICPTLLPYGCRNDRGATDGARRPTSRDNQQPSRPFPFQLLMGMNRKLWFRQIVRSSRSTRPRCNGSKIGRKSVRIAPRMSARIWRPVQARSSRYGSSEIGRNPDRRRAAACRRGPTRCRRRSRSGLSRASRAGPAGTDAAAKAAAC